MLICQHQTGYLLLNKFKWVSLNCHSMAQNKTISQLLGKVQYKNIALFFASPEKIEQVPQMIIPSQLYCCKKNGKLAFVGMSPPDLKQPFALDFLDFYALLYGHPGMANMWTGPCTFISAAALSLRWFTPSV